MKFKYLLYAALASTLTFAACGDDDPIPTPAPEKEPTVAVTAGKADVTELTFTVTPADAKECRYVCVENIDGFDAEKILAEGTAGCRGYFRYGRGSRSRDRVYHSGCRARRCQ